jgi:glycosyltransferase involved in cell wall biosynthesis
VRVLWHSNAPWVATGYGVQTRLFTPRIRDLGHEVAISAFYGLEGASIQWNGMSVYPRAFHPYGMDVVAMHAAEHKADVVISLVDAWVIDNERVTKTGAKWVPWFPVDHDPIPARVTDAITRAYLPIAYSRHAVESCKAEGVSAAYVPHGVETDIYAPYPDAKRKLGFADDAFVIGIVAANKGKPSRKALPTQIEAFSVFQRRHPEAVLYLHSHLMPDMDGLDIPALFAAFGVPESAVRVCDQYRNIMGYPDQVMASIYSAMDVLSSATMGEGFGVPIIEAQACGTPVIVGDWTAMPELVGAGWKVTERERVFTPMDAFQYLPTVDGVLAAYEAAYEARGDQSLRKAAREFAMQYDADAVTRDYWRPVLADIEARLSDAPAAAPSVEVIRA